MATEHEALTIFVKCLDDTVRSCDVEPRERKTLTPMKHLPGGSPEGPHGRPSALKYIPVKRFQAMTDG